MPADDLDTLEAAHDYIARLRGDLDRTYEAHAKTDATDQPNVPASGHTAYSGAGHGKYVSSDGNAYNTGRLRLRATGQLVNSLTLADVAGLTPLTLGVGTYGVRGQIMYNVNQTGASIQFLWAGTVTATFRIKGKEWQDGTPASTPSAGVMIALNTAYVGGAAGALNNRSWEFDGEIVVTGTGTFNLRVNTSIAADTFTISSPGSYLDLLPVT
jgi:hypothetical protein